MLKVINCKGTLSGTSDRCIQLLYDHTIMSCPRLSLFIYFFIVHFIPMFNDSFICFYCQYLFYECLELCRSLSTITNQNLQNSCPIIVPIWRVSKELDEKSSMIHQNICDKKNEYKSRI